MVRIAPLALALALLAGCGAPDAPASVTTLGSTSAERVLGTLAERFREDAGRTVTVEGGGSGAGVEAARNGSADIGVSSRYLTEGERASGLRETVLALDAIAVVVHADNPVESLTLDQLRRLYTGRVPSWAQVGGADLAPACIGRESGSGTRDGFESAVGAEGRCVLAQELISSGAVVEAVRRNPHAIGYASLSAVEGQEGIRAVAVEGVPCTEEAVLDGDYPIQRPFILVTREDAPLSRDAQAFFDFAVSGDAAELIYLAGAVPAARREGEADG